MICTHKLSLEEIKLGECIRCAKLVHDAAHDAASDIHQKHDSTANKGAV